MDVEQFSDAGLSDDAFLNGRLQILQPRDGYRGGVDPVLLAAASTAKSGDRVLELGCGAGVAMFCLAARVPGILLTGIEVQPAYATLAQRNGARNEIPVQIHCADITNLPEAVRANRFDQIIANPPYFDRTRGPAAPNAGRDLALAGETPALSWIETASRRLEPRGWLTLIQDMRKLPDYLSAAQTHLGSIEVLPLAARVGRAPHLFLLRARKTGRADFVLHAPLVMHQGDRHIRDGESYTREINAILRHGAALTFPGR